MNDPRLHRALISQFRVVEFSFREKIPLTAGMLLRWFRSSSVPRNFETIVELDTDLDDATVEAYLETVAGWSRCKIVAFDGMLESPPQHVILKAQGDSAIKPVADQLIRFLDITKNWFWPYRIPRWVNSLSRRKYYSLRHAHCTNNSVNFLEAMCPIVKSILGKMSKDDLQRHELTGRCNTVWTKQQGTGEVVQSTQ